MFVQVHRFPDHIFSNMGAGIVQFGANNPRLNSEMGDVDLLFKVTNMNFSFQTIALIIQVWGL